ASRLKEVLFLPAVMIPQKVAVVRKKTDQNVLGIWPRFDRIEHSAKTMIKISNLAVIARLYDFRQRRIDGVRPDGVLHVRNLFIPVIFLGIAEDQLWHSIGVVHSIERNRWSQRRMRAHERNKSEKRARNI